MKTLKMYHNSINHQMIDEVVEALRDGQIIIYPTDSVYAIGCDALSNRAIERVCRLKGIDPNRQRLSIVCSGLSQASEYARIDNNAFSIIKRNTPGAVTFILPASTKLPKVFKGRKEAGIRIPDCAIARTLAERLGNPMLSATIDWDHDTPEDGSEPYCIADNYRNDIDLMIDAGEGSLTESTIVDLTDSSSPVVLRQGSKDLIL